MEDRHLGKIPILWGKPLLLRTYRSSNTSLIFLAANYFAKAFLECQANALQQQIEKGITRI
jgi:hypothetical protein